MPVKRTKETVLMIGTVIGFAAFCGSACAETTTPQNHILLAQGFGRPSFSQNNPDDDKKDEEKGRHQKGRDAPPPPPSSHESGRMGTPQPGSREEPRGDRSEERKERPDFGHKPSRPDFGRQAEEPRRERETLGKPDVRKPDVSGDDQQGHPGFGRKVEEPKRERDNAGKPDIRKPDVSGDDDQRVRPGFGRKVEEPKRERDNAGKPDIRKPDVSGDDDQRVRPGFGRKVEEPKRERDNAGKPDIRKPDVSGDDDQRVRPGFGRKVEEPKRERDNAGKPDIRKPDMDRAGRHDSDAEGFPPKVSREELDSRRKVRQEFSREHLPDISRMRKEHRDEGGRVVLEEPGNRRILKDNGRSFIQHDETERLRHGAGDLREERGSGGERRQVFTRPDGVAIITVVDADGRPLRRMRRDHGGREVVLFDNHRDHPSRHRGHAIGGFGFSVELAPPVVRIPHEQYYVDADTASEDDVYEALSAPPVDDVEADYTLDEIRYSPALRDRMRRVNLSTVNFEFGSWEIPENQIDRLDVVARSIRKLLRRNPDEVFLIGGYTDAVGSDDDNLSLSDRRAESVARVLTDEFGIPAENLVTQGYGEQYLLIDTQEPERRNRRVEFQRITPMLSRQQQ
jgi:outer membrane protein OmpA-like peptidoglycan-associated protein